MGREYKYIGKTVPIHDIEEKVSGKMKYACDMDLPGMLHAKLLLSTKAHAKIKNIDISKAEQVEGVVKILLPEGSPTVKYNSHKWYAGHTTVDDELIFTDHPLHVGDRIGAVIATKKSIAEDAARLIEIEYEELPVDVDPLIVRERQEAVFKKTMQLGDYETATAADVMVFEDTFATQKVHHAAMETHVCVASPDRGGVINVWTPCQVAFQVRILVSQILEMPLNKVRVIKTTMGGSFGGKGQPVLEPVAAFLAQAVDAPVKVVMSRKESILGSRTRNAVVGNVKTKVTPEGLIVGRDIDMTVDAGAYYTNADAVAMAMGKKSFRMYSIPNQTYHVESVLTHTPVAGACRGYGSPQYHAVTEIHMDRVAKKLDMDPIELRMKNFVDPFDKDPMGGPDLGDARAKDCVEVGANSFKWNERRTNTTDDGRYVKAVGMGCATHGNGYFNAFQDYMSLYIRLDEDGQIFLNAGFHDQGCGTITTMQQIVGEVMDMALENIFIPEVDTLVSPYDSAGTQASRVTFVCGRASQLAAQNLKKQFVEKIAVVYACKEEDIQLKDGRVHFETAKLDSISYSDAVIRIQNELNHDISETLKYQSIANPAVYAANFVEVEIDKFTGLVRVTDVLAVHDIGQAINRGFVEGQIQGAIQMGIGYALTEEIEVDAKGRVKGDTFAKYHVVNAPDMPTVKVELVEAPDANGPFGAKSVGEISTCAIAPAIISAIEHGLGIELNEIPATPERVLEAMRKAGTHIESINFVEALLAPKKA